MKEQKKQKLKWYDYRLKTWKQYGLFAFAMIGISGFLRIPLWEIGLIFIIIGTYGMVATHIAEREQAKRKRGKRNEHTKNIQE